ncbi:thiol reductant ABC exporter subunit CydC [Vallicoccus soli]|uniref:Thiol reductant ABC exporter subunit CydC n=1 Tax=Vallicoccus soli TaxID=2339232 RepID=A0A3A3Z2H5_9ACTN|nr:thiol reductant ABC exporter subunit CydC [Vallicoccus soli]RJK97582.1 thiol reductant ABC exporter subunit CydC [Vallicoccus soli]
MSDLLRLLPRGRAALAVLLGTLTVLCGAALLAASGALITGAAQRPSTLLVLMPLITAVRLFGVARAAARYAERLVSHDLTLRLVTRLRAGLLERLVPLAPAALTGVRGGDLLATVRADVDELQGAFVRLLAPAAVAVVAGGAAVALTALVSPALALVLAALLVLLGAGVPLWARRAGRRSAVARAREEAAVGADVLDLLHGLADHLGADGGRTALGALDAHLDRQVIAERSAARVAAATTWLREGVPALGLVAALWLVGEGVAAGGTDPALLAAAALGVLGAFEAVAGLGAAWAAAAGVRAAADRVRALGALEPAVREPGQPLPAPGATGLRLEGVALTYPGAARPALDGLDLEVGPGDKVALTGPSGAGKSTVLALALRARDPDRGRVLLGGTDARDLALADVRARSAWSAQSPQLLGGTVAGNLRLARHDATDADLAHVLRALGLDDVLDGVGLHGWVGESGERLSAGERARVSVARALLSPAPLLLLDEPTAHLDGPLAARVLRVLADDPRAVLLVTHSPAALDARWRVVEVGSGARTGGGAALAV